MGTACVLVTVGPALLLSLTLPCRMWSPDSEGRLTGTTKVLNSPIVRASTKDMAPTIFTVLSGASAKMSILLIRISLGLPASALAATVTDLGGLPGALESLTTCVIHATATGLVNSLGCGSGRLMPTCSSCLCMTDNNLYPTAKLIEFMPCQLKNPERVALVAGAVGGIVPIAIGLATGNIILIGTGVLSAVITAAVWTYGIPYVLNVIGQDTYDVDVDLDSMLDVL